MQIVLIEPDKRLRDFFSVNLTQVLDADIIPLQSGKDAWGMIEVLSPSLIISKDKLENENTVDFLLAKFEENSISIPIISIGTDVTKNCKNLTLLAANSRPDLLATTSMALIAREQQILSDRLKSEDQKDQSKNYCPVPLNIFKYFASIPFDIYIKLKRGDNFQFLKRINAKEGYDLSLIDTYESKNVTHLYIKKNHYDDFTEIANNRFKELLTDIRTNSKSKEDIQEYVLEQLTEVGFNESNLQLAQVSVSKINSKISNSDSKLDLINDIFSSSLGYRFRRSYMTSVIANMLVKNIDWGDRKHSEYLTMAAYVHDMYLESDEEMDIMSDLELEQAFLGAERDRVENHAQLAADKIKENDQIPSEVEKIVRHHHGSHNGSGYPLQISPQVQKLGIAFLVSEEFSLGILKSTRSKINGSAIIREIQNKFLGNKEVTKCLEAIKKGLVLSK